MTETTNIPANEILGRLPNAQQFGWAFSASHSQWKTDFVDEWRKGYIEWLPSDTDIYVVSKIGALYADYLVGWFRYCLDQFYDGMDEEVGLLRDLLTAKGLIPDVDFVPVDDGPDERCDDCEVMVPDGQGIYPDGDEGRRVCADCAKENN